MNCKHIFQLNVFLQVKNFKLSILNTFYKSLKYFVKYCIVTLKSRRMTQCHNILLVFFNIILNNWWFFFNLY